MIIGGLLQSGGIVGDIWKKAAGRLKIYDLRFKNILILGLGGGTAAQIFSQRFPKAQIIGVDIDPVVIRMGKKYFGLDKIANLKIVNQDAVEYVASSQIPDTSCQSSAISKKRKTGNWKLEAGGFNNFDSIIVVLYQGEKIPPKTEFSAFLKHLKLILSKDGILIFNRIFWDEHKKEAENFVKKAGKVFAKVELIRTVANLLVICR